VFLWQSSTCGISSWQEGGTEDTGARIIHGFGGGGGAGRGTTINFINGSSVSLQQRPGARRSPSLQPESLAGRGPLPSVRSAEDVAAEWLEHTYQVAIDRAKPSGRAGESFRMKSAGWVRTSPRGASGGSRGEAAAARADGASGWAFPGGRRQGSWRSGNLPDVAGDWQGAAGPEQSSRRARETRKSAEGGAGKSAQMLRRGLSGKMPSAVVGTWQSP
jgi:hypothetical protein